MQGCWECFPLGSVLLQANVTSVREADIVLDPFSGTGTFFFFYAISTHSSPRRLADICSEIRRSRTRNRDQLSDCEGCRWVEDQKLHIFSFSVFHEWTCSQENLHERVLRRERLMRACKPTSSSIPWTRFCQVSQSIEYSSISQNFLSVIMGDASRHGLWKPVECFDAIVSDRKSYYSQVLAWTVQARTNGSSHVTRLVVAPYGVREKGRKIGVKERKEHWTLPGSEQSVFSSFSMFVLHSMLVYHSLLQLGTLPREASIQHAVSLLRSSRPSCFETSRTGSSQLLVPYHPWRVRFGLCFLTILWSEKCFRRFDITWIHLKVQGVRDSFFFSFTKSIPESFRFMHISAGEPAWNAEHRMF